MSFRERIETSIVLFFLATLGAGFGAGIGAYQTFLAAPRNSIIASDDVESCQEDLKAERSKAEAAIEKNQNLKSDLKTVQLKIAAHEVELAAVRTECIPKASTIKVTSAIYGLSACPDNAINDTSGLAGKCDGMEECSYPISLPDPCPGHTKAYLAEFTCGGKEQKIKKLPDAAGKVIKLSCS